jgi:uncharacterized protein YdhG (YjbR/CyaY superfamily)
MANTQTNTDRAKRAKGSGLSEDELAAMKERLKEVKRAKSGKSDGRQDVLDTIAKMPEHDRKIATRIHEIVSEAAPDLQPKTWYGMPAYARNGKVVCFFKAASKFDGRYATLGFEEDARLDDGDMWETSYAILELTKAGEARITALVKKAAG